MPSQRYKLTVAYRGTNYHGWQIQAAPGTSLSDAPPDLAAGRPTVERALTQALIKVVRHPLHISGSSRTDAGVHAKGQLVHFDTDQLQIPPEGLRLAANTRLPDDILIRTIEAVPDSFDAIRGTVSKRYQYAIWNRPNRPNFFADLVWHRWQDLNFPAMQAAAKLLVGTHDFTSFARPGHGRATTVRTILHCSVARRGPLLIVAVEGTGFLWNMVRIMVGTLVEVGLGRFRPEDMQIMLQARDRTASGSTAPAHGLYLHWIKTRSELPEAGSLK